MIKWIISSIAALFLAVIVHVLAVLTLPMLSSSNVYSQALSARLVPNSFYQEKELREAGVELGGLDPAMRIALCPLNLQLTPVAIRAPLFQGYWSVSIFDDQLNNIAVFNKSSFQGGLTDIVVGSVQRDFTLASQDEVVSVLLPHFAGFALLRLMPGFEDQRPELERVLAEARCTALEQN